jgi:hypothetical protein
VASPPVQVRIPAVTLAAVDEARGDESRSAWILGAIGLRLSPVAEAVAELSAPGALPGRMTRDECTHPKARVIRGFCGNCGTGGLG